MITEKALPSRGMLPQKLQDLYEQIQFVISVIKVNFKRMYPHTPELIKSNCFFFSCYIQCRKIPIFSRWHDTTIFSQMRHIPFVFQFIFHYFCSHLPPFLFCAFGCTHKNKSSVFLSLYENIVIILFKISQMCSVACWYFIHTYVESHGVCLQWKS